MPRYRHFFIENDAVHVSIQVPVRFTNEVRDAAAQRRVTANELVFTAVSHVLEAENAQAAYTCEADLMGTESNNIGTANLAQAPISQGVSENSDSDTLFAKELSRHYFRDCTGSESVAAINGRFNSKIDTD